MEREVARLPETHRVVFLLSEVEGLDTAEAARALGVTEWVVKTGSTAPESSLRGELKRQLRTVAGRAFTSEEPRCDRAVAGVLAAIEGAGPGEPG